MTMKKPSEQLKWLEMQMRNDEVELQREKERLIQTVKKLKKEDILPKKEESKRLTLWQKIKKVLMGL